jgi:LacI family transcriptional regulator
MSADTRERVKRIAAELEFRPNSLARSLISKRSFTVGLLTDDTYGRFTLPVMAGVSEGLIDHGVSVFLCAIGDDPELGQTHVNALVDKQVDGIIATGRRLDRALPVDLSSLAIPIIYVLTQGPEGVLTLLPDDRQGARDAVRHLVAQARRRIAHVTGPANFHVVGERAAAYAEVLAEAGLAIPECGVLKGRWSEHWGHEAVARWFEAGDPLPDGVFCGNDQIARGVIDALRERGILVPRDVSVVGFDNWEILAEQTRPPLTSVDMNLKELGRQAGMALLNRVNGDPVEQGTVKLPCTLRVRSS